jgi:hypothetical protein
MENDLYHLVTVKDGKSDTASIIKVFYEMATGGLKNDIRLLNYYNEMPVSYGATINAVDGDSVELSVHEHQALIMKLDNSTLIKSTHFKKELGVHCFASYVSVPKKKAILHRFAYAQIRSERREAVRVKVYGAQAVTFTCENAKVEGTIVTISGTGVAIHSSVAPEIDPDQPGLLYLTLAGTSLAVSGSFVRATKKGNGGHICIFRMKPDLRYEPVIGQFIYQRQVEIFQELKDGLVME